MKKVERPVQEHGHRKYLIQWRVHLGQEQLAKISQSPRVLDRALSHVKTTMKESGAEIYRIVPIEEVTGSPRPTADPRSLTPKGIAIVEASSVETVRRMVDKLLEGLTFGGFPVTRNYIEFDISPLAEVGEGG